MAEILVMATPINGLVAFVNKDLTPVQLQRLRTALSPEESQQFSGTLLASAQVPLSALDRFTRLAAEIKGEPVAEFAHRAGRFGGEYGLRTVYKFLLTFFSPHSVMRAAPAMFKRVYSGGHLEVEALDNTGRIKITEFPSSVAVCGRITGWLEVIGERAAKPMTVKHVECAAHGAPACIWDVSW